MQWQQQQLLRQQLQGICIIIIIFFEQTDGLRLGDWRVKAAFVEGEEERGERERKPLLFLSSSEN